jgi:hypothetical protein
MRSTRDLVLPGLERMVTRAGITGPAEHRFWEVFQLLTRESLGFNRSQSPDRFSGICLDGTPWQFCVVIGSQSRSVRFLTEVGSPGSPLSARIALTIERMNRIFDLIGAGGHQKMTEVLAGLCPADDCHHAGLWVGFTMGVGKPRVRVYANNGWGEIAERWLRVVRALRQLDAGGFGASLQPHLPLLVPNYSPAGFAITAPASPALCKLYLRPINDPWISLRVLARSLLGEHARPLLAGIEDSFAQSLEKLPPRALLVSVAGNAAGGALDLKIDLCGHCLFENDSHAAHIIERLANSFGLDSAPFSDTMEDLGLAAMSARTNLAAFVGVGGNVIGNNRINVYLTPPPLSEELELEVDREPVCHS